MTNITEPAAPEPLGVTEVVAGLEPVAWYMAVVTEHTPPSTYAHVSWGNKPDDNIHTEPLYSAATVEKLIAERGEWKACAENGSAHNSVIEQLAAMTAELNELRKRGA